MDHLVALPAENQGLPPTRGHASDPEGLLPPPWSAQVGEPADVVHFAVLHGTAQFGVNVQLVLKVTILMSCKINNLTW